MGVIPKYVLFTGVMVRFACPVVLKRTVQFSLMEG